MARYFVRSLAGLFILTVFLAGCTQSPTPTPTEVAAVPVVATVTPAPEATVVTAVPTLIPATPTPTPRPPDLGSGNATLTTVEVVKLLSPSVVQVQTEAARMDMFGQPVPATGVGTGIIVDTEGHILTNNHVVQDAQRITVSLSNGQSFDAEIVGTDPLTDLAVVRISGRGLQPAKLGDSSALQVGEDVVAIGHALGLPGGPTVSTGVVSALNRSIQADPQTTMDGLIQTDSAINPGNSGGPLVNHRGEVVGINTAIIPQSQGIGFAININDAKFVMAQLIDEGFVERAFLGIVHVDITPAIAKNMGLTIERGVGVLEVVPGSGADEAGLTEGDILVKIGDQVLESTADLLRFLSKHKAGETLAITYYRDQAHHASVVTLGTRPDR